MAFTMTQVTIIVGSTLGTSEYVGDVLTEVLEEKGAHVKLVNKPTIQDFTNATRLLLITSTHGAGEYPDNLAACMDLLEQTKPELNGVRYAVVAIGDSSYDTFCGAGKRADVLLDDLHANRIVKRLDIDILEHSLPEDPAKAWLIEHFQLFCG